MPMQAKHAVITGEERRAALRASDIFQALQPAELEAVAAHAVVRRFERGAQVVRRGDPGRGMLLILRGRVRVVSPLEDGRELTLGILGPGEALGEMSLLDGQERSADVSAVEDCTLMLVERAQFMRLLRDSPEMCLRIIALLSARLRAANASTTESALLDLPSRLGRLLLRLARECGAPVAAGTRIELKLSQKDLGSLIGGSREHVNRQLRLWEADGVVGRQAGYIVIRRPGALGDGPEPV